MTSSFAVMFPIFDRCRSSSERLEHLHRDVEDARRGIEQILDRVARRNGIPHSDVDRALELFADAMLEEATAGTEEEIALNTNDEDEENDHMSVR